MHEVRAAERRRAGAHVAEQARELAPVGVRSLSVRRLGAGAFAGRRARMAVPPYTAGGGTTSIGVGRETAEWADPADGPAAHGAASRPELTCKAARTGPYLPGGAWVAPSGARPP
jgi:hypothetical protein